MSLDSSLKSINRRFKKYIWFFVLLPVLTGVISYLLVNQQNTTTYTASEQIALGHYEGKNPQYTGQSSSKEIILSTGFLNEVNEENGLKMSVSDLQSNLSVNGQPPNVIMLSLTGQQADVVKGDVSLIAKAYVNESKQKYNKKLSIVKAKVEDLKNSSVAAENVFEKEEFLYQLQLDLLNMKAPEIVESVTVSEQQTRSPRNRAVLGVLVGIILSLFFLLVPEVLRDHEKVL